jgi:hypothetical protein
MTEFMDDKALEIPPKIKKKLVAVLIAAIIGSVCFFVLPWLREALIVAGENWIVHRELTHPVWHTRLTYWGFTSVNVFLMVLFFGICQI